MVRARAIYKNAYNLNIRPTKAVNTVKYLRLRPRACLLGWLKYFTSLLNEFKPRDVNEIITVTLLDFTVYEVVLCTA